MGQAYLLVILLMAISWHHTWAGLQDHDVIDKIYDCIWEGQPPQDILENNAKHPVETVILATRNFVDPLVAYSSSSTCLEKKFGDYFYIMTFESVKYDGCVQPPVKCVAVENGNGTITLLERNMEVCYMFQWPNNGVAAIYTYNTKGDGVSREGAIKVDWKKIRNRDILCQAIRYFERSGLRLFLRKIFHIDWCKETGFSKFEFDPDHCVGEEYVEDLAALECSVAAIKKKQAEEEAARLAAAEEAARLQAQAEAEAEAAAAEAAEAAAAQKEVSEEEASSEEETVVVKKKRSASYSQKKATPESSSSTSDNSVRKTQMDE